MTVCVSNPASIVSSLTIAQNIIKPSIYRDIGCTYKHQRDKMLRESRIAIVAFDSLICGVEAGSI
jgi:hypothetical protein